MIFWHIGCGWGFGKIPFIAGKFSKSPNWLVDVFPEWENSKTQNSFGHIGVVGALWQKRGLGGNFRLPILGHGSMFYLKKVQKPKKRFWTYWVWLGLVEKNLCDCEAF